MDLLYILIAQVGGTPDFSTTPPPGADIGSWWPLITTIMSLVVAAIAALFTAWQKLRERKLENSASSEQSRLQLEIEELKHQFESRKQLHDQLSAQITNLLTEGRELREELKSARTEVSEKETLISDLRAEVTTLQSQINILGKELEVYKKDVAAAKVSLKELPKSDKKPNKSEDKSTDAS